MPHGRLESRDAHDRRHLDDPRHPESILEAIGDTPLVRLDASGPACSAALAKVERSTRRSIKDRVARVAHRGAERDGKLKPGGTIVEPTSGNTGTGLANRRAAEGLPRHPSCPTRCRARRSISCAPTAPSRVAPTEVGPDHPASYYRVADRLTAEIPGPSSPNQ